MEPDRAIGRFFSNDRNIALDPSESSTARQRGTEDLFESASPRDHQTPGPRARRRDNGLATRGNVRTPPTVFASVPNADNLATVVASCLTLSDVETLFACVAVRDVEKFNDILDAIERQSDACEWIKGHRKNGYTLLHWLCLHPSQSASAEAWEDQLPEFVQRIIRLGADVDAVSPDGVTALHLALGWSKTMRETLIPLAQAHALQHAFENLLKTEPDEVYTTQLAKMRLLVSRREAQWRTDATAWRQQDRTYRSKVVKVLIASKVDVGITLRYSGLRSYFNQTGQNLHEDIHVDSLLLVSHGEHVGGAVPITSSGPASNSVRQEVKLLYKSIDTTLRQSNTLESVSPLQIACLCRDASSVRALLKAECKPQLESALVTSYCARALDAPAQQPISHKIHKKIFKQNWSARATSNDAAMQLILQAAWWRDEDILHFIMEAMEKQKTARRRPFINATDEHNATPFSALLRFCPTEKLIAWALKLGADVHHGVPASACVLKPLHIVAGVADREQMVMVCMLLDKDYCAWEAPVSEHLKDVDPRDLPRVIARQLRGKFTMDARILRLLIDAGADPAEPIKYRALSQHCAAPAKAEGATSIWESDVVFSVLDMAVLKGSTQAVDYLLTLETIRTDAKLLQKAMDAADLVSDTRLRRQIAKVLQEMRRKVRPPETSGASSSA